MPALDGLAPAASRLHGLRPAGRDEPRGEVRQRRQHEETLPGEPMRNHEVGGLRRIVRPGFGRTLDLDPVPAEHEEVQVQLARPPPLAVATPERRLEPLERDEEGEGAGRRVRAAWNVDRDDGVAELGLVGDADRLRGIEPGNRPQPCPGQGRQSMDAGRECRRRVAEVRPQPDVGPDRPGQRPPPAR